MVSELSARLLKGYNITYSTASTSSGKRLSDFSSNSSSSGSSNAESDLRTKIADPLRRISAELSNNNERDRLSNRDACFKRRKIDELRFAASRVKEDLEKGGLPFPSIHAKKPRALEGYDINMKNVQLLGAKSVADSPFLTKSAGKRSFHTMCEIEQLFMQTQKVYSKRWIQGDASIEWDKSSSGSLTSDSESSCVVDIPPLLEDALNYKSTETKKRPSLMTSVETISMATALENSPEPRLVCLTFAPFLIIHVNSAYTRMTGIAAKDVLGKAFRDVFKDKRCKAMTRNISSLASMHEQLTSVYTMRQDKRCNCSLKISMVGAVDETEKKGSKKSNATHCMVSLLAAEEETPNFGSQLIVTTVPSPLLQCGVVG